MLKTINGTTFRKMVLAGVSLLEQNKEYIDSLNVFPVPDGDTGTNMFLTMKSAVGEINKCMNNDLSSLSEAFSKNPSSSLSHWIAAPATKIDPSRA